MVIGIGLLCQHLCVHSVCSIVCKSSSLLTLLSKCTRWMHCPQPQCCGIHGMMKFYLPTVFRCLLPKVHHGETKTCTPESYAFVLQPNYRLRLISLWWNVVLQKADVEKQRRFCNTNILWNKFMDDASWIWRESYTVSAFLIDFDATLKIICLK